MVPEKEIAFVADTNDEMVMLHADHYTFGIVYYYYDVPEWIPQTDNEMMNVVLVDDDDDDDKIHY